MRHYRDSATRTHVLFIVEGGRARCSSIKVSGPTMLKRKVLLVDDNAMVRSTVRPLFDFHPKFVVCGEAEHGCEAIEKASDLRPDLIVLDMSMPLMNGLEAAPLLIKILPNVSLILFTTHDFPELQQVARAAGIHAVVLKSTAATQLIAQAEALFEMAA